MLSTTILKIAHLLAVLCGAFLLFSLEPLAGKLITPGFGGTAGVWNACLLFFQIALLAGYFFAYAVSRFSPKKQALAFAGFLLVAAFFAVLPDRQAWVGHNIKQPAAELISLLCLHLGLPFVMLSSISVMMQTWYRYAGFGNPYPLYSISNIGSMAALFAYPFLIEPNLTVSATSQWWTWFYYGLTALLIILAANNFLHGRVPNTEEDSPAAAEPSVKDKIWWITLSAGGSAALLSFTTYLTQDISPMPLLWILPLSVYLLSFVILFSYPKAYLRRLFTYLWIIIGLAEPFMVNMFFGDNYVLLITINLLLLFLICMFLHGEIVESRPEAKRLPGFYLCIATGGALGGAFINFVAPAIFSMYVDRQVLLSLLGCLVIYLVIKGHYRIYSSAQIMENRWRRGLAIFNRTLLFILPALFVFLYVFLAFSPNQELVTAKRNFYSSIKIIQTKRDGIPAILMIHGRVIHGIEYIGNGDNNGPGIYWKPVSLAFKLAHNHYPHRPLKIGVLGLGAGFSAAFAKPGDAITYYELDPKVVEMARKYFSFLRNTKANTIINTGDGRITLAAQMPQQFDLLLIDAFNGDAIPVHLLTKEALNLYLRHLQPNGLLVFNVTNKYINIIPVLGNLAKAAHLKAYVVTEETSSYVLLSHDDMYFAKLADISDIDQVTINPVMADENQALWTDDYVNIIPYIK